jgi:hypothetical protein
MSRRSIVTLMVLCLGLQGPVAAYASTVAEANGSRCALMSVVSMAHAAGHAHSAREGCCPGGAPAAFCCASLVAVAITGIGKPMQAQLRLLPSPVFVGSSFLSRGNPPLLRPPIP